MDQKQGKELRKNGLTLRIDMVVTVVAELRVRLPKMHSQGTALSALAYLSMVVVFVCALPSPSLRLPPLRQIRKLQRFELVALVLVIEALMPVDLCLC